VNLLDLKNTLLLLIAATALFLPSGSLDIEFQLKRRPRLAAAVGIVLFGVLLPWCAAVLAAVGQNPFIYYRF
jgi:hypothetical protein